MPSWAGLIERCRVELHRSRPGWRRWLGFDQRSPASDLSERTSPELLAQYQILTAKGRVVWGAVAQVNMGVYRPGPLDLPGVTVYSVHS